MQTPSVCRSRHHSYVGPSLLVEGQLGGRHIAGWAGLASCAISLVWALVHEVLLSEEETEAISLALLVTLVRGAKLRQLVITIGLLADTGSSSLALAANSAIGHGPRGCRTNLTHCSRSARHRGELASHNQPPV
jgi:hypothetical protein